MTDTAVTPRRFIAGAGGVHRDTVTHWQLARIADGIGAELRIEPCEPEAGHEGDAELNREYAELAIVEDARACTQTPAFGTPHSWDSTRRR